MASKKAFIIAFVIMTLHNITAQEILTTSSQSIGIAGISTIMPDDGIDNINPALTSMSQKGFNAHISYSRPYNLKELQQTFGKLSCTTKLVDVIAEIVKSGDEASHYTSIGGGLARNFTNWSMGLSYYYLVHSLGDNQKFKSSYSRIGIGIIPNDKWTLSIVMHNIENRDINYISRRGNIEPAILIGTKWTASSLFGMLLEVEKKWEHDPNYKIAGAIYPIGGLDVTVGYATKGHSLSVGGGYVWEHIKLHVGIMHHEQLGVTSGASLGYNIKKRE